MLPGARRPNQHPPAVPDDVLLPLIEKYYQYGWGDKVIAEVVLKDVDGRSNGWGLSAKTVKRRREAMGLLSVRQQALDKNSVGPHIELVREAGYGPNTGVKRMQSWLRMKGVLASEAVIAAYNRQTYPQEVAQRRAHRLKRKQCWTAGVFAVVACDQHDKWKPLYGITLHLGMDLFLGALLWVEPWWNNSNPRLIFHYYLQMACRYGGIPLITQSDAGSENNGIANGHSMLRQCLDPSLVGQTQHSWCPGHSNVRCEAKWSQLRREFTPSYEDVFAEGVRNGLFHRAELLDAYVFRWVVITFLKLRLEEYRALHNASKPRADRNKILPVAIPEQIIAHPERYGARDYRVIVGEDDLQYAQELYAPPAHPVFQLVPPDFDAHITAHYDHLGRPPITLITLWSVFSALRSAFQCAPSRHGVLSSLRLRVEHEMTIADEYLELVQQAEEEDDDDDDEQHLGLFGLDIPDEDRLQPVEGELLAEIDHILRPDFTQTDFPSRS